ncbi:hypothetical protein AHAS_Ahas01G0126200 [Arachis hypogaea]
MAENNNTIPNVDAVIDAVETFSSEAEDGDADEVCHVTEAEDDDVEAAEHNHGVGEAVGGSYNIHVDQIINMEFMTPGEVRGFYNEYSREKGFDTRNGKTVKNAKCELRYTFVCN